MTDVADDTVDDVNDDEDAAGDDGDAREKKSKFTFPKINKPNIKLPSAPASKGGIFFFTFFQGLILIVLFFAVLSAWIVLRSDRVAEMHQDALASKTVLINIPKPEQAEEDMDGSPLSVIANDALMPAPFEGMIEPGTYGRLPKIRVSDGLHPFDAYKKPFDPVPGKPMVALVVSDLGLSQAAMKRAVAHLPTTVTFAFSPYSSNLDMKIQAARTAGHEPWLNLSLETRYLGENDLGSQTVLRNASIEQNVSRLAWQLAQGTGYAGIIAPAGQVFGNETNDVNTILAQIFDRGLGFVEGGPDGSSSIALVANQRNLPYGVSDMTLDPTLDKDDIVMNFREFENRAMKQGLAIGYIHPSPLSIQIAKIWIESLEDKGIQVVPLSTAVTR